MVTEDDKKWRVHVEERLRAFGLKFDAIESQGKSTELLIGSIVQSSAATSEQLAANTRITLDIKEGLDRFKARAEPSITLHENMVRGAALVGRFADWAEKWGKRFVHFFVFCGALYLFVRLLLSGAGWAEAVRAFINK